MKKNFQWLVIGVFSFVLYLGTLTSAFAASCTCNNVCSSNGACSSNFDPITGKQIAVCTPGTNCRSVSGTLNGTTCEYFTTSSSCNILSTGACNLNTGSQPGTCTVVAPTPTPTSGGGGTGGSCTGACFGGLSNCGQVGRQPASGSCASGEMCCGFGGGVGAPICGNYSPNCGMGYAGDTCNASGVNGPPYVCIQCNPPNWQGIGSFQYANCTNNVCGNSGPPGAPVWRWSIPAGMADGAVITPGTYYPFFSAPGGNVATAYQLTLRNMTTGTYEFNQQVTGGEIMYQNPRGWPLTIKPNTNYRLFILTFHPSLAGCVSAYTILTFTTIKPVAPAPTVSVTATPATISSSSTVTVSWSSTNATSCTATGGWTGTKLTSGTTTIAGVATTTTYTITCTNATGSATASDTVTFSAPPPAAPTLTFTASPTTVPLNGNSTLTWSSTNTTSCTASGDWIGAKAVNGTQAENGISSNDVYTLTCTGPGGTISKTVNVNVASLPPLPVVNLTAAPTSVPVGGSTKLTWTATNATTCTSSNGWTGARLTSGTLTVTGINAAKTFVLSCTGTGGTSTDSVTVTTSASTAPSVTLTASPATVPSAGSTTLTWTTTNATTCTSSGSWTGARATNGSLVQTNITAAKTYVLTCTGPGGSGSDTVTVNLSAVVIPAPTLTFTVTPASISAPTTVKATWSATNATSCTASGGWTGAKTTVGTLNIAGVSTTTSYTLRCVNSAGTPVSITRTVTYTAPPPVACTRPTPQDPAPSTCAPCPTCNQNVDWTWAAVPNANQYFFQVVDSTGAVVIPRAARPCASGTCTVTTSLAPGRSYRAIVSAHSSLGLCTPDSAAAQSNLFRLDVCTSTYASTVLSDPGGTGKIVGPGCSASGTSVYTNGGTVSVSKGALSFSGAVNGSGGFSVSNIPNDSGYDIKLNLPVGSTDFCTCPLNCTYPARTVPVNPNIVFYTSPVAEHWFQTIGGDIAALSTTTRAVNDPIPVQLCGVTGCDPNLSLPLTGSRPETAGSLLVDSAAPVSKLNSAGGTGNVSAAPSHLISVANSPALKESYDSFYRQFSVGVSGGTDFSTPNNATKPCAGASCKSFYYQSGNLTVDTVWNVASGDKVVVFVGGNLTINKDIKLAKGGFVAFIVKGTITISDTVGTSTYSQTTDGQVQGMYFTDQTLTVASTGAAGTDLKFIGEGTFAAKRGIDLPRDFKNGNNGAENNKGPASLFIYRPDLIQSAPEKMKSSTYTWREVAP